MSIQPTYYPLTICSNMQILSRNFSCLRRLKTSRWPSHSIPYDFLKFTFSCFTPQVRLFFVETGNLKCLDLKMWWKRNQKNYHFRLSFLIICTQKCLQADWLRACQLISNAVRKCEISAKMVKLNFALGFNTCFCYWDDTFTLFSIRMNMYVNQGCLF